MPKITKQSNKKTKQKTGSVVKRIAPVGLDEGLDKINIYGVSGTGKTTVACTYPKPLLIAGAENGTRSVHNLKGVDFVRMRKCSELTELIDHVRSTGKYKSFVLDTVTSFQAMSISEIAGLEDIPVQGSWGMATRDQWGQSALQTKEYLRRILRLAEDEVCHAIILAQERSFGTGDTGEELLAPSVMSALTASTVGWLNPECDYICQTYKRQVSEAVPIKISGKTRTRTRKTDQVEFCLRVGPHPLYTTKFRGPKGYELPGTIVDPNYTKLQNIIYGKE
jgi:hypothetical protein